MTSDHAPPANSANCAGQAGDKKRVAFYEKKNSRHGREKCVGPHKTPMNGGMVSHQTAMDKATAEHGKYRRRTINELSSAERDFLADIKDIQKKLEGKSRRGKKGADGK